MTHFWIVVAAMALAAIGVALVPVLRAENRHEISRKGLNARVFRDREAELDAELAEGRLDPEQHRELKHELARTLLDDAEAGTSRTSATTARNCWIAAAIAVVLPAAGVLYYYQSAYRGPSAEWIELRARMADVIASAASNPQNLPQEITEDLPGFTRALQSELLANDSQDPEGWLLLGVSYLQLQAPMPARTALEKAYRLDPERIQTLVSLAQARILGTEGQMDHVSAQLLGEALRREPSHQGALLIFGFGAYNAGRYQEAIAAWERLLTLVDATSERARIIENTIAQARLAQAGPPDSQSNDGGNADVALDITVEVSADVASSLSDGDTLFVFAKAREGPRMPLAVVRQAAAGFPVRVTLDDSLAMTPAMKLSDFTEVVVEARVSKSGDVAAAPGDLESTPAPVDLSDSRQSLSIVIDRVVQ